MQYSCTFNRLLNKLESSSRPRARLCLCLLFVFAYPSAGVAQIYRSVAADGTVSFSDRPSVGARVVPQADSSAAAGSGSEASLTAAQEAASERMQAQLELAERLAIDRRERSAARQERVLLRAQLREAQARERALAAEQAQLEARQERDSFRSFPDYGAPYYPGRRGHRHPRAPAAYEPFDPNYYDKRYYPYQQPAAPEPPRYSRVPSD